jgi:uncharacterized membrane protein YqhA
MKFLKEENEHLWNLFLEAPTNCSINHDSVLNGMKSFTEEQIKSMLKSYPSILDIGSISVIELLKDFIELSGEAEVGEGTVWRVIIHLTFVLSGVLFALMDWIADKREFHGTHK